MCSPFSLLFEMYKKATGSSPVLSTNNLALRETWMLLYACTASSGTVHVPVPISMTIVIDVTVSCTGIGTGTVI